MRTGHVIAAGFAVLLALLFAKLAAAAAGDGRVEHVLFHQRLGWNTLDGVEDSIRIAPEAATLPNGRTVPADSVWFPQGRFYVGDGTAVVFAPSPPGGACMDNDRVIGTGAVAGWTCAGNAWRPVP